MSWIFGILRKNKQTVIPRKEYHPFKSKDKFSVETKDYYFASGTGHKNSFYKYNQKKDSGWMVCGTGISYEKDAFRLMDFHDWEAFLSKKNNNIRNLNGHFVIVEWEPGSLRIKNDQLGMRDMFFADTKNYLAFSTRLDWLIPFIEGPEIDFEIFSSSWLCVNPLSDECFITNTERLGQGGSARFEDNNFTKTNQPWLPEYALRLPEKNYFELISDFTTQGIKQNRQLLLGLSGGLDSRLLLSILLQRDRKKWRTYTFGDGNFPDAIIAKKLAAKLGFNHTVISNLFLTESKDVDRFVDFVLQTHTYMIGSLFYEQDHYKRLNKKNLIIDGGKGEYCTRSFAKWLSVKGKRAILERDTQKILNLIPHSKPNMFIHDITKKMIFSCQQQIEKIIDMMPSIKDVGGGNWIDIFTIRTRTGNMGSVTQTRLDNIIRNYMPYLQPSFLRKMLELPVSFRERNNVYRSILHKGNSKLTQFPLVKDVSIIPFTLNKYLAFILGKLFGRFQKFHTTNFSQLFLINNKEFIMDTLKSKGVKEYPHYDYHMIQNMVQGYYSGQNNNAKGVLWWLTFDVWRKKLQNSQKITC
ncbi:MAG: asparagine synthase-related protein [Candidatus Celaenobacter antarcticus]|nr:asparagine synthase-related protein [Candidatus Celaenobacter antarcticus]